MVGMTMSINMIDHSLRGARREGPFTHFSGHSMGRAWSASKQVFQEFFCVIGGSCWFYYTRVLLRKMAQHKTHSARRTLILHGLLRQITPSRLIDNSTIDDFLF